MPTLTWCGVPSASARVHSANSSSPRCSTRAQLPESKSASNTRPPTSWQRTQGGGGMPRRRRQRRGGRVLQRLPQVWQVHMLQAQKTQLVSSSSSSTTYYYYSAGHIIRYKVRSYHPKLDPEALLGGAEALSSTMKRSAPCYLRVTITLYAYPSLAPLSRQLLAKTARARCRWSALSAVACEVM